jgi:hypothetical protein
MKSTLKLHKSILAIVVFTSLCFVSNYSYSQGLLGKIKKLQEDVKKTTDEVKKIKTDAKKQLDDVKNVTGTGGNGSSVRSGNTGNTGNTEEDVVKEKEIKINTKNQVEEKKTGTGANKGKTCYSCDYETSPNAFFYSIPKTSEKYVNTINISNETDRPILIVISLSDGSNDVDEMHISFFTESNGLFPTDLYDKIRNQRYYVTNEVTNTKVLKTVNDGGKFVYRIEAYYYFGDKPSLKDDGKKVFISNMYYNGTDLNKLDYTVKIVKTTKSDALFAELEKELQAK